MAVISLCMLPPKEKGGGTLCISNLIFGEVCRSCGHLSIHLQVLTSNLCSDLKTDLTSFQEAEKDGTEADLGRRPRRHPRQRWR